MTTLHRFHAESARLLGRPPIPALLAGTFLPGSETGLTDIVTRSKVFYKKVEPLPDSGADKGWAVPQYQWLEASWNPDKGSYHVMRAIAHGAPGAQRRRRETHNRVVVKAALPDHFAKFYEQMVKLGYTYGVPTKLGDNGMSGKGPKLKIGQSYAVKMRKLLGMPPLGS